MRPTEEWARWAAAGALGGVLLLVPLACVPALASPDSCAPPYATPDGPYTVSNMLKDPPLSSAFSACITVWTCATCAWLRACGQKRWPILAALGLLFACTPTGEKPPTLWEAHTALLGATSLAFLALTSGATAAAPQSRRRRAAAHRALIVTWCLLGTAALTAFELRPNCAPALLVAYGVAACEVAAAAHLAGFLWDVMAA